MANTIKIKNSAVAAKVPALSDLQYGEIALNYADGIIFYKRSDNTVQSISGASNIAASSTTSGYLTTTDWNTFNSKQTLLVSGTNIKTINGISVLGSGNINIEAGTGGTTGFEQSFLLMGA